MLHKSQKNCFIFVGILQYHKCYLIDIPSTRKVASSNGVIFDKIFSITLAYRLNTYSEALAMQPSVSYIMYATSYHEQTGDIITILQFEEGNFVGNKRSTE